MDNEMLFASVMLDDADYDILASYLSKIADRIDRAARAIEGDYKTSDRPDTAWQKTVPASDITEQESDPGADIVLLRHDILPHESEHPILREKTLTVPRIVG